MPAFEESAVAETVDHLPAKRIALVAGGLSGIRRRRGFLTGDLSSVTGYTNVRKLLDLWEQGARPSRP